MKIKKNYYLNQFFICCINTTRSFSETIYLVLMSLDILVVDDEADIRELMSDILKDAGYSVRTARNSVSAFDAMSEKLPAAIILDIWLKDSELDGLGILETVSRKYPFVPVIMISGHGNIETAITSLKMGAFDYIEKPFKQDRLLHTLKLALDTLKLKYENEELRVMTGNVGNLLTGGCSAMQQLKLSIEKTAPTGSRIFITGPSGCGKETVARAVHEKSSRNKGPFIVLNTAVLGPDNADKILFGTEDSGDINAPPRTIGVFEQADKGTLFVDEVTDIPISVQGKFVRFLQDKTFERKGGTKRIEADVRVISATSRNIQIEIEAKRFREDLFYRLNVVNIKVPALKERREDIPLLAEHFLSLAAENSKTAKRILSEDAIAAMQAYDWPGNVRQLRNVIEWLLIMNSDPANPVTSDQLPHEILSLTPASVTPEMSSDIMSLKLREAREVFEKQYLTAQINRFGGNISRTASFIGMERSALHRKLKMLEVATSDEKVDA